MLEKILSTKKNICNLVLRNWVLILLRLNSNNVTVYLFS